MIEAVPRAPTEIDPGRMQPLARLPVFLALQGKRVVVAGEGPAAAWKAELLSAAGAQVDVYAVAPGDELLRLAGEPAHGRIALHRRAWTPEIFAGAAVAVGGCESEADAAAFATAARAAGVPVNVIDKPDYCDFAFGAIVNRSPLVVGISTDGAAPVFAQAVRAKIEAMLPQGFARWAAAAARWRGPLKATGLPFAGRRKFWHLFTAKAVGDPNGTPSRHDFDALVAEVTGQGKAVENGSVTLVGAGPGDPELLTLRAVRALQSADVILFDDLVSNDVLDFARREARKMLVGKTGHGPSCKQDDINALMVGLARAGKRVVRLKGGDPLIFARAAEEIEACKAAGIAVDIVPGITAAQGAAARLGLTLTDRANARRLQFVTGHAKEGGLPEEIDWRALADPATTTAVYMGAKTLPALVSRGIAAGLDPQTPAIAIARATRPDQAFVAGSIIDLPALVAARSLPAPLLIVIGHAAKFAAESAFTTDSHRVSV